jgi:hypothetical protein
MTPVEHSAAALKEWLETAAGYEYILHLADWLVRDSQQQRTLSSHLSRRFSCSANDLRDEIAQEFLVFFLDTFLPQLKKRPDQVNAVLTGRVRMVLRFALQQFSWRLQDGARLKEANPRAYLHRRLREVLRQDDRFIVQRDAQSRVSCSLASHTGTTSEHSPDFYSFEYGLWPCPPEPASRDGLFTAKYLSETAQLFLQEMLQLSGENIPVPIRELVRYLSAHFSWLASPQLEPLPEDNALPASTEEAEQHFTRNAALESITALALQFVRTMDDQARKILFWTLEDPPYSFKKIAGFLGYSDHNGPYRIHRNTIAAMQQFCANWPGPPLAELPEEVGITFIEKIRQECKKSVSRP